MLDPPAERIDDAMRILRPAGLDERRCICRDVLGFYSSIVSLATYTLADGGSDSLPWSRIIKALKTVILQHPTLSTVILDSHTPRPQLARPDLLDINYHLRVLDSQSIHQDDAHDVDAFLEDICNEPFDRLDTRPAWRLYIRPVVSTSTSFQAAFASSHALADGRSTYLFHKSFLHALQSINDCDDKPVMNLATVKPVLPPLDQAAKFTISWSFLLRPAMKEYAPAFIASWFTGETGAHWTGSATRPPKPISPNLLRTKLRSRRIPHESIQKALVLCRTHDVKLTAFLNYLTAQALAAALQKRGQTFTEFAVETAIDMRRCVPNYANSMATIVSAFSEIIRLPPDLNGSSPSVRPQLSDEEWACIRQSTEGLAKASGTLADQVIALLAYLDDFFRWTNKKAEIPAESSFSVSNLGAFDNDTSTDTSKPSTWAIKDIIFTQSADATGAPFNLNVASTKNGDLAIGISWWPGMLGVPDEEAFAEEICLHVEQSIAAAVRRPLP